MPREGAPWSRQWHTHAVKGECNANQVLGIERVAPCTGKGYLVYGGDTTCLELRTKNDAIIIVDAGSGIRRLGNSLIEEGRFEYDFLFTHAHWDHLMGFPFFKPLFMQEARLHMQGCPYAREYVKKLISRVMAPPNFPIRPSDIKARLEYGDECALSFQIDTLTVTPIGLTHPNRGSGYRFEEDGKAFVFLTDNELDHPHVGGLAFEEYRDFVSGVDVLYHDAEYTPEEYERTRGWGHSVYTRVLDLGLEAGVGALGLFHLNQDRSDDGVDRVVNDSRRVIRERGGGMDCFAVAQDMVMTV
ncbi:MBL fold metallo-hydrolase [Thermodesulfobacteriota bacterium]